MFVCISMSSHFFSRFVCCSILSVLYLYLLCSPYLEDNKLSIYLYLVKDCHFADPVVNYSDSVTVSEVSEIHNR